MITESPPGSPRSVTWEKEGLRIFSNENKFWFTRIEKQILKVLIYKGTPEAFRKKLWLIGSGALREMKNNPNYYTHLLEYSSKVYSPSAGQIDLDLKRTFPDNLQCTTDAFYKKLRNVLLCYSVRNSTIGYCQGMNFIVGRLLLILDNEEEAFWLFAQIVEYLLPLNYYSELAGVITETTMISFFLNKYLPSIYDYFINNHFELTVNNFIHKWLVCLFTQNFDENITKMIWDFFFLEGSIILTKTCLGIFSLLKNDILTQFDFEDIYNVLNDKTNDIKDPKKMIYFLAVRKYEFDYEKLTAFRSILQIPIIENLSTEKQRRFSQSKSSSNVTRSVIKQKKNKDKECNPKWPTCLFDETSSDILEVLVLKKQKKTNLIFDYYYDKAFSYPVEDDFMNNYRKEGEHDVLCERKKHNCIDKKIVENSIVFLDKVHNRSNSYDLIKPVIEENHTDLYEIINKGTNFANAKEWILTDFSPLPISNEELIEL